MAQFIRSAKSASDWTDAELLTYSITVTPTSPEEFFGNSYNADPSLEHLDPTILTSPNSEDPNLSDAVADYLGYLDLATHPRQENVVNDFTAATLKLLGFNERHSNVATRYNIPLTHCCETRDAQADVCLVYHPTTVLLVCIQNMERYLKPNVEAHVVAQAIAAFQFNNKKREARAKPVLDAMTIPCISMLGTIPTFYLVPVTQELSKAVISAQSRLPTSQTRVLMCVTVAADLAGWSKGMADLEFRKLALNTGPSARVDFPHEEITM
ncbi:hypothetical protein BKA70DRAFT_1219456 [Coprinopsis sp. MPI-PUGE-AT-0042]|nr:hypothetical protein BKA70DRAFT_1219456 [Coprinopsis sp. MPI-PUGE-AT-0042]